MMDVAMAWLEDQLADGPRRGAEIKRLAKLAGISASTLRRARENICEKPERGGFAETTHSLWSLRSHSAIESAGEA